MKKILLTLLLFVCAASFAQTSVNDYKYVVVPAKFDFLTKKDQFRINTLTKLLLEKYGFTAYLDSDVMPDEVVNTNCNKLYAHVESDGNFIRTKLIVVLKDCKNNILFTSAAGTSKDKDWAKAYNEALREAFQSFATLHYKYSPKAEMAVVAQKSTTVEAAVGEPVTVGGTLFAQPITNGYQLVDSTPKIVMKIYRTSNKDTYTAIKGNIQGVLVSKEGQWFFEYYENDQLVSQKTDVKF